MNLYSMLSKKISEIEIDKKVTISGRVKKFDGNVVFCDPFPAPIGSLCLIKDTENKEILSEIIGFNEEEAPNWIEFVVILILLYNISLDKNLKYYIIKLLNY